MVSKNKTVIGTNVYVMVEGVSSPIAAKIDTGADGTSLWASGLRVDAENKLLNLCHRQETIMISVRLVPAKKERYF